MLYEVTIAAQWATIQKFTQLQKYVTYFTHISGKLARMRTLAIDRKTVLFSVHNVKKHWLPS